MRKAALVLEDGTVYEGRGVGAHGVSAGEACFTTAMAGYEEAVTDPSYAARVLVFSLSDQPHGGIGGNDFSGTKKMSVIAWLAFFFEGVSSTRAFGPTMAQPPG